MQNDTKRSKRNWKTTSRNGNKFMLRAHPSQSQGVRVQTKWDVIPLLPLARAKLCPGSVIIRSDEQSAKIGVSGRRAMRRKAKERRAPAIR